MKRLWIKTVMAAVALGALGMASAQEVRERTIKFATQNPKGHPVVMGMEKYAELVNAKSGGKIKINLVPGGVLGSDQANVSAVQGGTLEMVVLNSGILASVAKEMTVLDFPFLFASAKEADTIVDGPEGLTSVSQAVALGGGVTRETDERYRLRATLYLQAFMGSNTRAAIEYVALTFQSQSGVRARNAATYFAPSTLPGYVELVVDDGTQFLVFALGVRIEV